jgi:uncharacterized protein
MDSLNPESPPVMEAPAARPPRIWKFWGTALWGLFIFAAMFVGQLAVVGWFVLRQEGPLDMASAVHVLGGGLTISLSVIMGLPAVLAALWVPIRLSRTSFADYLALRWTSWQNVVIGIVAMVIVVAGWDMVSRATGREVTPGFMGDVLQSAFSIGDGRKVFWASPAPSCCRRWCGRRCICNTTGSFSARCFRLASCSAISAIAAGRSG